MDKQSMYTAQEMRDFARAIDQYGFAGACMGKSGDRSGNTIVAMLRQAADTEDELAKLNESKNRWMQYQETAAGERNACIDELRKKDAEIAQLRTRLETVAKECEKMRDDFSKRMRSFTGMFAQNMRNIYVDKIEIVDDILRTARGEGSAPQQA